MTEEYIPKVKNPSFTILFDQACCLLDTTPVLHLEAKLDVSREFVELPFKDQAEGFYSLISILEGELISRVKAKRKIGDRE